MKCNNTEEQLQHHDQIRFPAGNQDNILSLLNFVVLIFTDDVQFDGHGAERFELTDVCHNVKACCCIAQQAKLDKCAVTGSIALNVL